MTEITQQQMVEWLDKSISAEKQWPEAVRAAWPISIPMMQAIRAALQQQAQGVVIDEGELWSLLRNVLSQGEAIWQDSREKCYEEYSAHLDYAARVRKQQLVAILKGEKRDQSVAGKEGAG